MLEGLHRTAPSPSPPILEHMRWTVGRCALCGGPLCIMRWTVVHAVARCALFGGPLCISPTSTIRTAIGKGADAIISVNEYSIS